MSRARNLKPAFFKNEDLAELPFEYRLLFQGLWCLADREGRLENRPKRIKAELFPYDDVDVDCGLDSLEASGFIQRYPAGESTYIQVVAFSRHQNPHCKEVASTIPAPCQHSASTADSLNPQPDSLNPMAGDARPVQESAEFGSILDAYHALLPNCQRVVAMTDKRKRAIRNAEKNAKRICRERGWDYGADFWRDFFAECAKDEWLRGDRPNPNNPAWRQSLDVLLRDEHFAKVMDAALGGIR